MIKLAISFFISLYIIISGIASAAIDQANDIQLAERTEIPLQNTPDDFIGIHVDEAFDSKAIDAWEQLASGPIVNDSTHFSDALHDLGSHLEGTDVSYWGYLLLTEKRNSKEKPKFDPVGAMDFLEASLRHPQIYFSDNREASSQVIIADAIKQLLKSDQNIRAWQNCLKLRWLSPHIDLVSSICRSAGNRANDTNAKTYKALTESIRASGIRLLGVVIDPQHQALLSSYLSNPYNPDSLKELISYFGNTNQIVIGKRLLYEYCQMDYECLWSADKRWIDPILLKLSISRE